MLYAHFQGSDGNETSQLLCCFGGSDGNGTSQLLLCCFGQSDGNGTSQVLLCCFGGRDGNGASQLLLCGMHTSKEVMVMGLLNYYYVALEEVMVTELLLLVGCITYFE